MIRVVRLGTPRQPGEGPRLGTVRRPPRGVKKKDFARLDYYDLWLPLLAPSQKLVGWGLAQSWSEQRWARFAASYRREMRQPVPRQLIELLALLSRHADFSVGCYCENAARCHRSLLKALLAEQGAKIRP